ncbi:MAG TPA: lipoyl(octanoyl) transferase LipB [Methylotenera sp.]|nr:lipoyl(octanoyl) transferase LipB [Methylotenera sp.]
MQQPIIVKRLGVTDFETTWRDMQKFTVERAETTADELWLTEHPAVYTLGLNRKNVRLPARKDIPVVLTDRGGKITYHGPGQIIIYALLDLKRNNLNIRSLVSLLENAVIGLLADYQITAIARTDAPGVYVNDAKIAALGLRIKNNYCYHGLSLNVNMDLTPFKAIDPCGYVGLEVTQTKDLGIETNIAQISELLLDSLTANLGNEQLHV